MSSSITLPATASPALDNLQPTAINAHLSPESAGSLDLGNSTNYWNNLYVNNIHFNGLAELSGGGINITTFNSLGTSDSVNIITGNGANGSGGIALIAGSATNPLNRGSILLNGVNTQTTGPIIMDGASAITNLADPSNPQDAATKNYVDGKIQVFTSSAGTGGASTQAMTVTGLLSTDTILGVTQATPGANNKPMIGFSGQANNSLTINWGTDPGAGAVVRVAVLR